MNFSVQDDNLKGKRIVLRQELLRLACKIAEIRYETRTGYAEDK
jgi:hypothetical protein